MGISNQNSSSASINLSKIIGKKLIEIEGKILSLKECSASDFKNLGKIFKKNYQHIQLISQNIETLFGVPESESFSEFATLLPIAEKTIGHNLEILSESYRALKKNRIKKHASTDVFFSLSNLKQNLNSLSIIIENAHLGNDTLGILRSEADTEKNEQFRKIISAFVISINEYLQYIKENQLPIANHVDNQEITGIPKSDRIELNFSHISEIVADKKKFILTNKKIIEEKTAESNESISEIIKNLQYDDIIRQKIEHIHQIQSEISLIISGKSQSKQTESVKADNKNLQAVIQILEIINLLTAQLLHTNEAYQKANTEISGKLKDISYTTCSITEISLEFANEPSNIFINIFLNFQENLIEILKDQSTQLELFINGIGELKEQLYKTQKIFSELNINNKLLEEGLLGLEDNQMKKNDSDQFRTLKIATTTAYQNAREFLNEQIIRLEEILQQVPERNLLISASESNKELLNKARKTIEELKIGHDNLIDKVEQNISLCKEISDEVDSQVNKITYYDFFEKSTEEIISILKGLHQDLKEIIGDQHTKADLAYLEEYYSMESERIIHENTILGKTRDSENQHKPEDDNLELF